MKELIAFLRYKKLIKKIDPRFDTFSVNVPIWDKVFKNGPGKICGRQPLIPSFYSLVC